MGCHSYEIHAELRCFVLWLGKGGVRRAVEWLGLVTRDGIGWDWMVIR